MSDEPSPTRVHLTKLLDQLDEKQLGQLAVASDLLQMEGEISAMAALEYIAKRVSGDGAVGVVTGRTLILSAVFTIQPGTEERVEEFEPDSGPDSRGLFWTRYVTGIRIASDPAPPLTGPPLAASLYLNGEHPTPSGHWCGDAWQLAEFPYMSDQNNRMGVSLQWGGAHRQHGTVDLPTHPPLTVRVSVALDPVQEDSNSHASSFGRPQFRAGYGHESAAQLAMIYAARRKRLGG